MAEALNPELVAQLRVESAIAVAADIRQFELVSPNGAELPEFTPGAHLLVQAPNGATRRYSISNAPGEREHYVIAVKREASGRGGSISMVDGVNVGDLLHVSLPRNEFELKERAASYLFIAGGIGITPIRSMVHHLIRAGDKPFKLYYLSREPESTAYRDEFTAPSFHGKVVVHHDLGDPNNSLDLWPMLETPSRRARLLLRPEAADRGGARHDGPLADVGDAFRGLRHRHGRVRTVDDKPLTVRVGVDGAPIEVPAGVSILEALRANGHRIRSSCESGTCGSCRMKLLAGEADHRDLVLTDSERQSEIIVCVSRAHSPELIVEL